MARESSVSVWAKALFPSILEWLAGRSVTDVAMLLEERTPKVPNIELHAQIATRVVKAEKACAALVRLLEDSPTLVCRVAVEAGLVSHAEFQQRCGAAVGDIELPDLVELSQNRDKQEALEELMLNQAILLHLDPRCEGVVVPVDLRNQPRLVLRFGDSLVPPIPDLEVTELGVAGTLTFGGVPFRCEIPWHAIFAVVGDVDDRTRLWPESAPEDLHKEAPVPSSRQQSQSKKKRDTHVPHLKLVE